MNTRNESPPRKPRLPYVAIDNDVRYGMELIASARTHSMAKRIAYSLNRYRDEYRRKNASKDHRKA